MYFKISLLLLISVSGLSFNFYVSEELKSLNLQKDAYKNLFLGKTKYINGVKYPIRIAIDSAIYQHNKFPRYFDTSPKTFKSTWRRKLFSGGAIPPRTFKSVKDLKAFLKEHKYSVVLTDKRISE